MDDTPVGFGPLYDELRRLAEKVGGDDPLAAPTSLVHEAWLKLRSAETPSDHLHFKRLAAKAMRQILVDRVRHARRHKRGGSWFRVTLADIPDGPQVDVLELNDALSTLADADEIAAELVTLRFFGGFTQAEAAETLGISLRTAERRWRSARALLNHLLAE